MQQSNERHNAEEKKYFARRFRGRKGENRYKQEGPKVTVEKVQKMLKSFPNWKTPGPDGVQGYWLKNFNSMHKYLAEYLHRLVQGDDIPMWMTKGKQFSFRRIKIREQQHRRKGG